VEEEEASVAEAADVADAVETEAVVVDEGADSVAEVEEAAEAVAALGSVVEGVEDPPSKARRLHSKQTLVR